MVYTKDEAIRQRVPAYIDTRRESGTHPVLPFITSKGVRRTARKRNKDRRRPMVGV